MPTSQNIGTEQNYTKLYTNCTTRFCNRATQLYKQLYTHYNTWQKKHLYKTWQNFTNKIPFSNGTQHFKNGTQLFLHNLTKLYNNFAKYTTSQHYRTLVFRNVHNFLHKLTWHFFYSILHNHTKLQETLQHCAKLCTSLHKSAQLCNTNAKLCETLQNSATLGKTQQHFAKLYKIFKNLQTPTNFTQLDTTLQTFQNLSNLDQNSEQFHMIRKLHKTLQHLTALYTTSQILHNFTTVYTYFYKACTQLKTCTHLHNIVHNCTQLYNTS